MAVNVPSHNFGLSIAKALALSVLLIVPAHAQMSEPPVTVANPISKQITQWNEFSGRFEAIESVDVRPRVSGFIDKVHFRDGQMVKHGDLLFTIDKRPFEIALESAQAEIAQRKAEVSLQISEV